jgi:hypothetical protein
MSEDQKLQSKIGLPEPLYPQQQSAPKSGGVEVYSLLDKYLKGTAGENNEYLKKKLKERYDFGKSKYGQGLMTGDGRNSSRDLEEELLDAIYYLAKCLHNKEKIDNSKMMLQTIRDMIRRQEKIENVQTSLRSIGDVLHNAEEQLRSEVYEDSNDEYLCKVM